MSKLPEVVEIKLLQKQRTVKVSFADGFEYTFSCKYLREQSPSAEMKGHGGQRIVHPEIKQDINIVAIEPVGNYAVKLIFDDGHQSGLYSWQYLHQLAKKLETNQ